MLPGLAYSNGGPLCTATLRAKPEDFVVIEELPFSPAGEGEHLFVRIRKRNSNTEWVARQLARYCDVHPRDIGYAGLKDRAAVTTQWFSVHLPGKPDPDWQAFDCEDFQVLEYKRHNRKLKSGALKQNFFRITLRDVDAANDVLLERLQTIQRRGVPNYFGEQRFGRDGENLEKATAMFQGKLREKNHHRRGMYLSAARSHLFNLVLSSRVDQGTWDQAIAGDCYVLNGSHSFFCSNEVTEEIRRRITAMDIHPSGPLWGRGELGVTGECLQLEEAVLGGMDSWKSGLEKAGLKQERRALRLPVPGLEWKVPEPGVLELEFALPAGCYATSVLREIVHWESGPA